MVLTGMMIEAPASATAIRKVKRIKFKTISYCIALHSAFLIQLFQVEIGTNHFKAVGSYVALFPG